MLYFAFNITMKSVIHMYKVKENNFFYKYKRH